MAVSEQQDGAADRLLPLGSEDSHASSAGSPKNTGKKSAAGSKAPGSADQKEKPEKEKPAASDRGKGRMKPLDIVGPDTMERGTRGSDRPPAAASAPPIFARLSAAVASTRRLSTASASAAAAIIPGTPAENDERPCWKKKRCYVLGLLGCLGCWGAFALIRHITTKVCGPDTLCPDSLVCTDESDNKPVGLDLFGKLEKAGTCQEQACTGGGADKTICPEHYVCSDEGKEVEEGQSGTCHWDKTIKKKVGEDCNSLDGLVNCRQGLVCFGIADGKYEFKGKCQEAQECNDENIFKIAPEMPLEQRKQAADFCGLGLLAQDSVSIVSKYADDEQDYKQATELSTKLSAGFVKLGDVRAMTICRGLNFEDARQQAAKLCVDWDISGGAAVGIIQMCMPDETCWTEAARLCSTGVPALLAFDILRAYPDDKNKRLQEAEKLDKSCSSRKASARLKEIIKESN